MLTSNINTTSCLKRRESAYYFSLGYILNYLKDYEVGVYLFQIKPFLQIRLTFYPLWETIKVRTYNNKPEGEGYPPMYSLSHFYSNCR